MHATITTRAGADGRVNEDWVGATPDVVVLLDGLSSISGSDTGCQHGTPWYVAQLGRRLLTTAEDQSCSLVEALRAAIEQVASLHTECDARHAGAPSATVAVLRMVRRDVLEYLVLADSRVVISTTAGVELITDERVDLVAKKQQEAALRERIGSDRHQRAIADLIATQKPLRNRTDGYWVAGGDPAAADHAVTGAVSTGQLVDAALFSDGASRIVDTFNRMSWQDVMTALRTRGPIDVIAEVRAIEASDPDGQRWPRYKTADDATIAYVNWS